jgi:hypothetical protein
LTLIGSSNFGSRSASRDLEAGVLVTTQNSNLRWGPKPSQHGLDRVGGDPHAPRHSPIRLGKQRPVDESNFGSRSASRDLEAGVLVTTQNSNLRWALENEVCGSTVSVVDVDVGAGGESGLNTDGASQIPAT